jgi:hypothetical protein
VAVGASQAGRAPSSSSSLSGAVPPLRPMAVHLRGTNGGNVQKLIALAGLAGLGLFLFGDSAEARFIKLLGDDKLSTKVRRTNPQDSELFRAAAALKDPRDRDVWAAYGLALEEQLRLAPMELPKQRLEAWLSGFAVLMPLNGPAYVERLQFWANQLRVTGLAAKYGIDLSAVPAAAVAA